MEPFAPIHRFLNLLGRMLRARAASEALWVSLLSVLSGLLLGLSISAMLGMEHGAWGWVSVLAGISGAGFSGWHLWWRPTRRQRDEVDLARWVEGQVPDLHSGVITSVQASSALSGDGTEDPWPGLEPALAKETARQTAQVLEALGPEALVDRDRQLRLARLGRWTLLAALCLMWWGGDVLKDGLHVLLEAPMARAAAVGDDVEEVEVLVEDLSLRLVYPAYLDLQPRTIPRTSGDVSAVVGTEVVFSGRISEPLEQLVLVMESDPGTRWPLGINPHGSVDGRFRVGASDRYRFEGTRPEGEAVREARWRGIEARIDDPPEVRLLHPTSDMEVKEDDEVELIFEAIDDHGLAEVLLVLGDPRQSEASRRSIRSGLTEQTVRGSETLMVRDLAMRPGDSVELWFEARDHNTLGGSVVGRSARRRLWMYSPEAEHEARLRDLEALIDQMIDVLADRLESPLDGDDPGELEDVIGTQQGVSAGAGRLVQNMRSLVTAMSTDSLTSDFFLDVLRGSLERLAEHHEQEAAQLRQAVVGLQRTRRPAVVMEILRGLNKEGIEETERSILDLKEQLDQSREDRILDQGRDLLEAQNDLRDLLEKLKSGADDALTAEAERTLDELEANLRRMQREMAKLVERTPYENQNPSQKPSETQEDMNSIEKEMAEIRELIRQGKIEEAMKRLEELNKATQELMAALQNDFGDSQANSPAQKELAAFEMKLSEVADGQQGVRDETREAQERADAERRAEMARKHREEIQAIRDKAAQLVKRLNETDGEPLHPEDRAELAEIRDAARLLQESVKGMRWETAAGEARQVAGSADKLEEEVAASEERETKKERIQGLQKAMGQLSESEGIALELAEEMERLSEMPPEPMSSQMQRQMARLERRQKQLDKEVGRLEEQLQSLEGETPGVGEKLGPPLGEARREMQRAGGELGKKMAERAGEHQQRALEKLGKAQEAMRQQRRQSSGGSSGRDGTGQRHSDRRVDIPDADAYRAPELRQELLDAMKERAPESYEEAIQRYYEELVR